LVTVLPLCVRRHQLGLPNKNPLWKSWKEPEVALLGKITDWEVSARTGHSVGSVKHKRLHLASRAASLSAAHERQKTTTCLAIVRLGIHLAASVDLLSKPACLFHSHNLVFYNFTLSFTDSPPGVFMTFTRKNPSGILHERTQNVSQQTK
jgi:hypothetical protein